MNALKSLFSSIHSDKAIRQLEALGVQMYKTDADGQKHFRNLHDVFMDLMITSHTTSQNMEKDLLAISGGKFQWSKVASVLGSYRDFLHAYTMSLDSTNFSQGQIAAQLDTINRKYEQLKATMTGIATGIGASGLSAYIKNLLSSLNSFAKSLQRIPTYVWKIIGGFVAVAGAIGACITVVKLFSAGMASLVTAQATYTAIVAGTTAATEGWAAATTAATGGLNILLGLIVAGVAAFLGYNAVISSNIEAINSEAQAVEDNVQVKRQEIEMSEKQGELIETLCNNHVKLQEALNTTKEGTEQHKRAEEDLAATDQALTAIIGEDAMRQIDWNGDLQGSINNLKNAHSEKTKKLRLELAQSLEAQASYQEAEQQRIEATITNLSTEGTAWTTLGHIIESVLHTIGSAMVTMGEGIQSVGAKVKEVFPDMGGKLQDWGSSIMLSGINHQNFHSEWSDDRADNANQIAALKSQLAQSKVASAKAKAEADAIRNSGGTSNPYAASGTIPDSGIVTDDGSKKGGAGSKGKGSKGSKGAKEADNSPEAMGYRYLTGKGLDKNMVLGILANIAHESSFNPDATNGDHWGMIQWDSDRWGRFLGEYLSMRGMSQSDYYSSDVNTKRTLQYDYIVHEMTKGTERGSYQKILDAVPSTPEQWAHLINMHYERSGVYSGGTDWERQKSAREYATRFERKNGEDNYTDGEKAIENAYKQAKKLFDLELQKLKYEREMKGEKVTALDEKALFEKIMFVNGKNPYALLEQAQKDYQKVLLEAAKYEAKRQEAIQKATETQVKAIEKMADAEVAFAEKLGIMSKQDVWEYNYQKNEKNYATKKPFLDAKLRSTVDMSKGTAEDILAEYQAIIDAQDEAEARLHAQKLMYLSRDVDATKKALDEELKLEEKYQQERYKLEQEAFQYKNRYIIGFKDAFVSEWQSGLESILNRTKSFGEAMRDMLKNLVNSMIKLFTEDWASRLNKVLSNALFPQKETGFALGTRHSRGATASPAQMASQFTAGNLGSWASSNLSLMGGGKKGNNGLIDSMLPQSAVNVAKTRMNQVKQVTTQGVTSMKVAAETASAQTLATETANDVAKTTAHTTMETTKTAVTTTAEGTRVATSNAAQATVMANLQAMMVQMLAAMAIMAVFGAIFGGGGSKTETSTSEVNLGRSPDSYYMTPSAVMQSTTFQVPSFDIGGNIEQDMFAMVHKGEMVLTPEQAEVIRSSARTGGNIGNGSANANVKSSINVTTVSSRGFEQVLRDYNRDLSKNVKKGIRNGYLNAKGLV